MSKNKTEI
jgi:hypothetical protein